jgi:DNA-binding LacI/PurR family transcriptional regulator
LASTKTKTIGVVITDYTNLSFVGVLKGLREIFDEAGYQVIVSDLHRSPHFIDDPLDAFASMKVDGLVLVAEVDGLRTKNINVPTVTVGERETMLLNSDRVFNDDFEGARMAIEYLWSIGHEKIAHLTGAGGIAKNRRNAYIKLMKSKKQRPLSFGVGQPTTEIGGYRGAKELLASGEKVTAIFAANDYMAAGAAAALHEKNIRVPQDISIIGYDNAPIASEFMLKLSTIDEQGEPVGRQAAAILLDRINGNDIGRAAKTILIIPSLVVRESTAPLKQAKKN